MFVEYFDLQNLSRECTVEIVQWLKKCFKDDTFWGFKIAIEIFFIGFFLNLLSCTYSMNCPLSHYWKTYTWGDIVWLRFGCQVVPNNCAPALSFPYLSIHTCQQMRTRTDLPLTKFLPLKRHQIEDVKVLWKGEIQELISPKLVSSFSFESVPWLGQLTDQLNKRPSLSLCQGQGECHSCTLGVICRYYNPILRQLVSSRHATAKKNEET